MFNYSIKLDCLKPNERAIILAIRGWKYSPEKNYCQILSRSARKEISIFITLLERTDPYAIKTGELSEQELQLFEVQLLYAISKQMAGNLGIVSELLNWWFPFSEQALACDCIKRITLHLKNSAISLISTDWMEKYFQAISSSHVRGHILEPTFEREQIVSSQPGIMLLH